MEGIEPFSLTDSRLPELEKELVENVEMLSGLYVDWAEGILSEEEYEEMKAFYSGRCKELEGQIRKRREREAKAGDAVREARQWLCGFKDIGSLLPDTEGEIRRSLICSLIDKIWVYEGKRVEFSFLYQDRMAEVYSLCGMFQEALQEKPLYGKGAV